eukprot:1154285-Pelagomonas_calceolata.AAC.2
MHVQVQRSSARTGIMQRHQRWEKAHCSRQRFHALQEQHCPPGFASTLQQPYAQLPRAAPLSPPISAAWG